MLTIGQLADFAGVTVRAVRHYHSRGLLPEPERDASGYRRYDARAVVDLIRIKTLADAGVPLARVRELLKADPDEFADSVRGIERNMQARIRQLQQHRRRVSELAGGDGLVLPAAVLAYLARLRAIGISDRLINIERDGWILLAARSPQFVEQSARAKLSGFDDEAFCHLYREFDDAHDWPANDPRIGDLVDRILAYASRHLDGPDAEMPSEEDVASTVDATAAGLVDAQTAKASPAWQEIARLLTARG